MHLSWEYPPLVYGGLGRHVAALTRAQADAGHEVTVLTQTEKDAGVEESDGIRVIRVLRQGSQLQFGGDDIPRWVDGLEAALITAAEELAPDYQPDVVHAHDWMVTKAALAARRLFHRPLVATIHATEVGRHQGWLPNDLSQELHSREWTLSNSANRVIICSRAMKYEVEQLFDLPDEQIAVVSNGIDLSAWELVPTDRDAARQKYAKTGPLLVQTGRLEWEKGVDLLLAAVPQLRQHYPGLRVVVAGRGTMAADFRLRTTELGIQDSVECLGWMSDNELRGLIAAADAVVVPSRYEPFGLVALEAAALGSPVVVAETGGLREIADGGRVALTFATEDEASLAAAVRRTIDNPSDTKQRVATAQQELMGKYGWDRVAKLTVEVYQDAAADYERLGDRQRVEPVWPTPGTRVLPEKSDT